MTEPAVVGGVYEVGIGVPDLDVAMRYWALFGYRPGPRGRLTAAEAGHLYGVDSALESVRLLHQEADHSLVRLMRWDKPLGPGLGLVPLRTPGNRWAVAKSNEVMQVANFAAALQARGEPVYTIGPIFHPINEPGRTENPFEDEIRCKREFIFFQPHSRHVLVQRYAHDLPHFGAINNDCRFRASQFTQVGLCIAESDVAKLDFYEDVLALHRHDVDYLARAGSMPAVVVPLADGELLRESDFDDVRPGDPPGMQRSGKLRIFRITGDTQGENRVADSAAGNLGFSLYTYRVTEIAAMRDKVTAGGATDVTAVRTDEFGNRSFSFRAPDGYFWTFVAA
ncbi:MAG: VOC family protein [Proteobacteria bacterium]|nr:VOC family protein [Pseudomonadota bacterium]MDA1059470.1 VOC family protein [Pseudomonadota bacterium]